VTPVLISFLFLTHSGNFTPWSETWTTSADSPLALAQSVDAKLHQLGPTTLTYAYECAVAPFKGFILSQCAIEGPKMFHIEYPLVTNNERKGMLRVTLIEKGGKLASKVQDGKTQIGPAPLTRPLPSDLIKDWFKNDAEDLFKAIGSPVNPFTALVRRASSPGSGLLVKAEHREVTARAPDGRHLLRDQRIIITRDAAHEKSDGKLLYEIVIDEKHRLPVSITNTVQVGKVTFGTRLSHCDWHTRFEKTDKKIDPRMFDFQTLH
jgi:hypothetical protein